MKKSFLFIIALAMCAGNAKALENEPEEGFTYMGLFGMNISKLQNHDFGAKVGATMGAKADYVLPSAHGTYITAGFDWTMKGGKGTVAVPVNIAPKEAESPEYEIYPTGKYPLHYFEIPIRVGFRYNFMEELGVYGEVGPYFAIGIGGKYKLDIEEDGAIFRNAEDTYSYKAFKNYGYPRETFQRWDAGIGFRVGAEYNQHYNLMVGCDWGLADIYRVSLRDAYKDDPANEGASLPKVHNFNISITFGYRF